MKPVKNKIGGRWIDRVFGKESFAAEAGIILGLEFSFLRLKVRNYLLKLRVFFLKRSVARLERLLSVPARKTEIQPLDAKSPENAYDRSGRARK